MTAIQTAASFKVRPVSGEAPFDLSDIFFSRTDDRGVIRSFNDVFMRIADYPAADLLGAPHRLIRHEDMPRGVFWLFWQRLKAGHPVGAYVKNKARDGLHYWVYAVVLPLPDGGYLSVRIKPSGPMFAMAETMYADLLAREKEEKLTPEASGAIMLAQLADKGFQSYSDFQARALASEIATRDKELGHRASRAQRTLLALLDAAELVRKERQGVVRVLDQLRLLPTNMRLISQRLERGSGPLSTISERYGAMVESLLRQLHGVIGSDQQSGQSEADALFLDGAARLAAEVERAFANMPKGLPGVDGADEGARLHALGKTAHASAQNAAVQSSAGAVRLARELDLLRRATLALDSIRVMCRVEFGQLRTKNPELAGVIVRIDQSHQAMNAHLNRVADAAQSIEEAADSLVRGG